MLEAILESSPLIAAFNAESGQHHDASDFDGARGEGIGSFVERSLRAPRCRLPDVTDGDLLEIITHVAGLIAEGRTRETDY